MFLDMNLSKEIMDSYRGSELCSSSPFEVEIQTLTNSHWSMKLQPPIRLPAVITECCDNFNAFYLSKFKTGRRLSWLTHVGGADLKVNTSQTSHFPPLSQSHPFSILILIPFNPYLPSLII